MKISIKDATVIQSGTIVARRGDQVVLYPFNEDPEFAIEVIVSFSTEARVHLEFTGKYGILDISKAKFEAINDFGLRNAVNFAENSEKNVQYFLMVAGSTIGPEDTYTLIIHYTFTEKGLA